VYYHQDYKGACKAFLDALKLDTGDAEIEDGLRYATTSYLHLHFIVWLALGVVTNFL
jgi:hypothetical protein